MSMAHSRPSKRTLEYLLFVALAITAWSSASALKSDSAQIINVTADHQVATLGDNGQVTLTGNVKIDQGSLGIQGDKAVGYENKDGQWDHAVVNGSPARFHQKLDNGSMVNGSATTIEYLVAENTVILTGDATVVQQGRGTFHGAKLTYNTDSGEIVGESGAGGQVHMTFQPKPKPAKAAPITPRPAGARSPAASAPVSAPVPSSTPAPASASTAGTH